MKRIFNVIVIVGAMIIMCTNIKYAKGYSDIQSADIKYSNQCGIDKCGVESIVKIIENCNIVILTKKLKSFCRIIYWTDMPFKNQSMLFAIIWE